MELLGTTLDPQNHTASSVEGKCCCPHGKLRTTEHAVSVATSLPEIHTTLSWFYWIPNSKSHIQAADWQNINWRLAERNSGKCRASYSNFCNRWWHSRRKLQWILTEPIHSTYHKDTAMREREPGTSCQVGTYWISERNGGKRNDHDTVNLDSIMLSERSHSKRTKYCRIPFILNVLSGQIYGHRK